MAAKRLRTVVAPALPVAPPGPLKKYLDALTNILRLYFHQIDNALRELMADTVPYNVRVARGEVAGATPVYKVSHNDLVGTTNVAIWPPSGDYPWITTAAVVYVSSDDANDTLLGTGAQKAMVVGLDADYNEISVEVELNGLTQVATTGYEFLRINECYVTVCGSGGTSAGSIYVANSGATLGVPTGDTYATTTDHNEAHFSQYTVPAGKTLYVEAVYFNSAMDQDNKHSHCQFNIRLADSNVFRVKLETTMDSDTTYIAMEYPFPVPEKSDLEMRAESTSTTTTITGIMTGLLMDD